MGCNVEPSMSLIRDGIIPTYYQTIKEFYPNIDIKFYYGENNKNEVIGDNILLNSNDGLWNTFEKTIECFNFIKDWDFDYVVRTNTSTYINVHILNKLIDYLNEDVCYGARIIDVSDQNKNFEVFPMGLGMIFSKKLIHKILETPLALNYKNIGRAGDDNLLGRCLLSIFKTDIFDHYGQLTFNGFNMCGLNYNKIDTLNRINNCVFYRLKSHPIYSKEVDYYANYPERAYDKDKFLKLHKDIEDYHRNIGEYDLNKILNEISYIQLDGNYIPVSENYKENLFKKYPNLLWFYDFYNLKVQDN